MQLSIIIPTKGRAQIFDQTIRAAIHATRHIDAELIVVNDSRIHTPSIPSQHNVQLVANPKEGVAAARNFGFSQASGEVILFLDNDILISKQSVDHVINLHTQYRGACFNPNWEYTPETIQRISLHPFSRFLSACGMTTFKGWYDDPTWQDNALFPSKSVSSFHLSIRREDFEQSGGYNEQFPFAGFEDFDFPLRLKRLGLRFYIDTRIKVYHNELDRLDLDDWLGSQEQRAKTRRKAVSLGYQELALEYHLQKRIALKFISHYESVFRKILRLLPNSKLIDPIYFKLVSALQASRIFKGYTLSYL